MESRTTRLNGEESVPRVEISGRRRGIKRIDLGSVLPSRGDAELLSRITHFDLSHNELEVVSQLHALSGLRCLDVRFNRIHTVVELPRKLTELNVSHNKLLRVDAISTCIHLQELDVSFNRICDISGLSTLPYLKVLRAADNRIQSTNGLERLQHLRVASLANNFISSAAELSFVASCPGLVDVDFTNNPVTELHSYRRTLRQICPKRLLSLDGARLALAEVADKEPGGVAPTKRSSIRVAQASEDPSSASRKLASAAAPRLSDLHSQATWSAPSYLPTPSSSCASASEADMEEEAARTPPKPTRPHGQMPSSSAPSAAEESSIHTTRGYATEYHQIVSRPSTAAHPSPSQPLRSNVVRLATSCTEAQLHDAIVAKEQAEQEAAALRSKLKRMSSQLKESQYTVSKQLSELSRTRVERDAANDQLKTTSEKLDRFRRHLSAAEANHRRELRTLQEHNERVKVSLEVQLADLAAQTDGTTKRKPTTSGGRQGKRTSEEEVVAAASTPNPPARRAPFATVQRSGAGEEGAPFQQLTANGHNDSGQQQPGSADRFSLLLSSSAVSSLSAKIRGGSSSSAAGCLPDQCDLLLSLYVKQLSAALECSEEKREEFSSFLLSCGTDGEMPSGDATRLLEPSSVLLHEEGRSGSSPAVLGSMQQQASPEGHCGVMIADQISLLLAKDRGLLKRAAP